MELMDNLQIQYKDFTKRMKGRVYYDDQETKSLLEGYTEELASFISEELDKAREEGRREVYEAIVFDENIPHDITTFVAANLWKNMRDKAKEELSKLKDNK